MLQEIIDLQKEAVSKLTEELKTAKKEITFKAPTGSGKTYMMADFMNRTFSEENDIVFLVSSLSKGGLAQQNYEKFEEYKEKNSFPKLNPYLINSEIAGEERLFIPTEHNVYLLPRDLYKEKARIFTQGSMLSFLTELRFIKGKTIILIKDECHIATNNLDTLAPEYFYKTINFSATPKLSRGQNPDVEITNEDAENAKLIKTVEWREEDEKVADAVQKFMEIKEDYRALGVNPCLIIQISNKEKADEELQNEIMPALNANPELKWMLIVDKDKDCDTNDVFKAKKLPVSKWKDYAKQKNALIDVIIFKMVITEGWDIPRACMLYQVRNTQSKQLDEQVIGRVRRNPRLLDFETLTPNLQKLAMTAWVWGIKSDEQKKICAVKLRQETENLTNEIKIKTTKLKNLPEKEDFDINKFLAEKRKQEIITHKSIFKIAKQLQKSEDLRNIVYNYASDFSKWREITDFLPEIEKESNKYINDYAQSMEIKEEVSFAVSSHYTETKDYVEIANWVWKKIDGTSDEFHFDSFAEKDWVKILRNISGGNENNDYLWGKNFVPNSAIKFEYYTDTKHSSFPDFVMKDKFGRIHIFEVKSVNKSNKLNIDENTYNTKIAELKKCYKHASKLTGQIFYLPVMKNDIWQITQFNQGEEKSLTKDLFEKFMRRFG